LTSGSFYTRKFQIRLITRDNAEHFLNALCWLNASEIEQLQTRLKQEATQAERDLESESKRISISPELVSQLQTHLGNAYRDATTEQSLLVSIASDVQQIKAQLSEFRPENSPDARVEPLTGRAQAGYKEIVKDGPLTGVEITSRTGIDQSTLTKEIIPELKRLRGIKNKRGAGYYSPRHYRPD